MNPTDKLLRALFVAFAVGIGWAVRGTFGHLLGASYPGAALGLAFAFVSGQRAAFLWMPVLGALGGIGIAFGGSMSYGLLHGYAQADTLVNYSYGFFTLWLQGGAWGFFGCGLIALALEQNRLRVWEWAALIGIMFVSSFIVQFIIVNMIGFHINPTRSDSVIGITGSVIVLCGWLVYTKRFIGLRGGMLGYVGFGGGMALGRLIANMLRVMQSNTWTNAAGETVHMTISDWNVMEMTVGLVGGFVFAWGMLQYRFPDWPQHTANKIAAVAGSVYVLALIPLLHLLSRANDERKGKWMETFTTLGHASPEEAVMQVVAYLWLVLLIPVAAIVGWLYVYFEEKEELGALPVLALTFTMIVFQSIFSLFFWMPSEAYTIHMQLFYWLMLLCMVGYAVFYTHEPVDTEEELPTAWWRWVGGAIGALVLIIIIGGMVNGPETMPTARTRFPIWEPADGPFPGTVKE